MTTEQIKQLRDMQAFIDLGIESDLEFYMILGTIGHDIGGLLREEECFLPRTHGCAKDREKLNSLPKDKNEALAIVRLEKETKEKFDKIRFLAIRLKHAASGVPMYEEKRNGNIDLIIEIIDGKKPE